MVVFIFGEDSYRSREKLREIVRGYKEVHKNGLDLKYYDGESFSAEDVDNAIRQTSMFKEKKLIVFQNIFDIKNNKENPPIFLKSFKDSEDIIVIYENKKIEKSNALFKLLKKHGKCQEFSFLERERLRDWIKTEFKKYNMQITPEGESKLLNFVGSDLWQLSGEIQKLANFKTDHLSGNGSVARVKISAGDVDVLVKSKIETDIFKTIDAIAGKNRRDALSLLHRHLEKGDNAFYLLSMVNFQFRNLLIVKDLIEKGAPYYAIAQKSKLHPFVARKSYEQAAKFSLQELKKIYRKIFEVDLRIKTGKITQEAGLDLLISEV